MSKNVKSNLLLGASLVALSGLTLSVGAAIAEPPPANTVIGNQAAATYTANGEQVTVQSNLVETIVNEVFGVDLDASQSLDGAPGGFVFFQHAVTNNANTEDVFQFTVDPTAGGDSFSLTAIEIFPDTDQDGVPDSLTPLTETPALLAGQSFGIVVRGTIPATVTSGETSDFTVTATSVGDGTQSVTNTDTVTITTDGIVTLQKDQALSVDADGNGVISVGDTVTVNLEYSNVGIADAQAVIIEDVLPVANANGDAITLTYQVGSGVWSDAPGITLTEDAGNTEATNAQGHSLQYTHTAPLTVQATIDTVPAGRTASLSFDFVVTAAPQGAIENIATVSSSTQTATSSNVSSVTLSPAAALTFADAAGLNALPPATPDGASNLDATDASTTDTDGALNDSVENTDTVFAGDSIVFDLVLTNLGNGADTFSLSINSETFPSGTQFNFVASDGVTPLIGDEITVDAGTAEHVQLIATLPVGTPQTASPAGFDALVSAVSQSDTSVSNEAQAIFNGEIVVPTVDLANADGTGVGTGNTDDGGDPFVTTLIDPGQQVTFPLQVSVPAGDPANSFELSTSPLPPGWSVEFLDTNGVPITDTGVLVPETGTPAVFDYIAVVTIPDGEAPATEDVSFISTSPSNGATDSVLNAITVNEVVDLGIESNISTQAAPGGTAVLSHIVTNLGNSSITAGPITLGATDPFTDEGFTAALFVDVNDDGVLDPGDTIVTDVSELTGSDGLPGLAPGESARLFVRVQVPSTTGLGLVETGDLTIGETVTTEFASANDRDTTNNSVTGTITIISGDVAFIKQLAIDAACDGTPDGAFSQSTQPADPGACLVYRLEASNSGLSDATNVIISDVTPSFTTLETCGAACEPSLAINGASATVGVQPGDEATGPVASSVPNSGFVLAPGGRAELVFTVQIDE